jgi:hypothetical protein
MKKTITKLLITAETLLLSSPFAALAQPTKVQPIPKLSEYGNFTGFLGLINTLLDWAFTFLLVLSVAFVLYAAYLYVTASGDSEKIGKANKIIVYAAIGVAIAVLSSILPDLVQNLLGSGSTTSPPPGGVAA